MSAATDYVGLSAAISALGAAVVGIIVALRQTKTRATLEHVAAQVETPNHATIGEIVAANDLTGVQHLEPEVPKP